MIKRWRFGVPDGNHTLKAATTDDTLAWPGWRAITKKLSCCQHQTVSEWEYQVQTKLDRHRLSPCVPNADPRPHTSGQHRGTNLNKSRLTVEFAYLVSKQGLRTWTNVEAFGGTGLKAGDLVKTVTVVIQNVTTWTPFHELMLFPRTCAASLKNSPSRFPWWTSSKHPAFSKSFWPSDCVLGPSMKNRQVCFFFQSSTVSYVSLLVKEVAHEAKSAQGDGVCCNQEWTLPPSLYPQWMGDITPFPPILRPLPTHQLITRLGDCR